MAGSGVDSLSREYRIREAQELLRKKGYVGTVLVGQGAFSEVFRSWDARKENFTACKVSEHTDLLKREAQLLEKLRHPLFVRFFEYFEEGARGVLVMEYVAGENLGTLLQRRGHMSLNRTRQIGTELAEGLRYLHELDTPMIYRDMKPDNILIRQDGRVKLIDLGCAGQIGDRAVAGSRGFAAPEQMLGDQPCGTYSDVYCLGRVMQVMCRDGGKQWRRFLDHCTRAEVKERIPDMRYFLRRMPTKEPHWNLWEKDALEEYRIEKNICLF